MHNHDGKGGGWMMWLMMFCCVLPLILILILGLGGKGSGVSTWVIFSGIIVMITAHLFIMGKSRKHSDEERATTDGEDKNKDNKDDKNHSGHGCCH